MTSETIQFTGALGDTLSARLDLPKSQSPKAYALFAHCFTCSKNVKAVGNIARALTEEGIAVFRFDFTGLGASEGNFADTNFTSNVEDLTAAAHYLETHYEAPQILIGHSLGGAAVLQARSNIASAEAIVTIGAPCNPQHVEHHFEARQEEILEEGEAIVTLAGRRFKIKKQLLDDLRQTHMDDYIRDLDSALLIFHSPIDNTVGIENAAHIFQLAIHPKSFISLDRADHLLTNEADSRYVGKVLATWADKYLET